MKKLVFLFLFFSKIGPSLTHGAENCIRMHVIQNAPIGYYKNGQPTGTHWDYLLAIEKHSGICIQKYLLPYARLWKSLEEGDHDGGIIFRSPGRENFVEYVAFIRSLKIVVIPRKKITLKKYADLQGLIIGKTRGTRLNNQFDSDNTLKKLNLTNYDMVAKMIRFGRLDAIAGSGVVLGYQLSKHQALDQVNLSGHLVLGKREQWLQISKKSKHANKIPKLKKTIIELQAKGIFDQIMTQHYGKEWKEVN